MTIRIRRTFTFTDDEREAIALYVHRRFDEPLRRRATREQCDQFINEALGNQEISVQDVLALEWHCKRCSSSDDA